MMKKISEDKRSIEVFCGPNDDMNVIYFSFKKAVDYGLDFTFGIDGNNLKYIRISGINPEIVTKIYEYIEKRFNN